MWYDLVIVVVLLFAVFRGAMKGIVWQLAVIASLLFCFFFAGTLSTALAPVIHVEPPLNRWIAMFLLYVGFSFVAFGAARVLREMIEKVKFEEYDRHLGAVLGLFKGVTFALFLTFFLVTLSENARQSIMNSHSGYAAALIMDRLHPVMPDELHDVLEPYIHQLDRPDMNLHYADHNNPPSADLPPGAEPPFSLDDPPADAASPDPFGDAAMPGLDDPFGAGNPNVDNRAQPARRTAPPVAALRSSPPDGAAPLPEDLPPGGGRDASRPDGDWLESLATTVGDELQQVAVQAWRNTRPEHREELKRLLTRGGASTIRDTAQRWRNGKPQRPETVDDFGSTPPLRRPAPPVDRAPPGGVSRRISERPLDAPPAPAASRTPSRERTALEQSIAEILVDDETGQVTALDAIERALKGLPEPVAIGVLRDWRADLRAESPDPDPGTTARNSLDERIVRQLEKSNVSLRSLDTATQNRLRGAQRR
jgi:membrane protein required for colicin V production